MHKSYDLFKIQYPIVKKGAPMSSLLNIYVIVHFIFTIIFFGEYVKTFQVVYFGFIFLCPLIILLSDKNIIYY